MVRLEDDADRFNDLNIQKSNDAKKNVYIFLVVGAIVNIIILINILAFYVESSRTYEVGMNLIPTFCFSIQQKNLKLYIK